MDWNPLEPRDDIGDACGDGKFCSMGRSRITESVSEDAECLDAADGVFDTDAERGEAVVVVSVVFDEWIFL